MRVNEDSVRVILLVAKCRVAPIKESGGNLLTFPHLELTAALYAARLQKNIVESIDVFIENIYL